MKQAKTLSTKELKRVLVVIRAGRHAQVRAVIANLCLRLLRISSLSISILRITG
jgi:hypothetical protein